MMVGQKRCARALAGLIGLLFLSACADPSGDGDAQLPICDADNGGLTLPAGFCAQVVADYLGAIRHLAVAEGGRLYVSLRNRELGLGGLLALQDRDGDGRYELIEAFGEEPGVGVAIAAQTLYVAGDRRVLRYQLPPAGEGAVPVLAPEEWVSGIGYDEAQPGANALTLDDRGEYLFLAAGTASNACQPEDRQVGMPGSDPCPRLRSEAGIWRIPTASAPGSLEQVARPWATGWRFGLGIDWHPALGAVVSAGHGRDQLHALWPEVYSAEADARLPAEEVHVVVEGADYGWPYCFFDPVAGRHQLAPEYAAIPERSTYCSSRPIPVLTLPAHSSPNDLLVYTGSQFPPEYRLGAFIALHGAYDPVLADVGRRVVFAPWNGQRFTALTTFSEGRDPSGTTGGNAGRYQPTGLALDHDGSLLVAESVQGRLWRIRWIGDETPR